MINNRTIIALLAVVALVSLAGCASLTGEPDVSYEAEVVFQPTQDEDGTPVAVSGAEGTVTNEGDAEAKGVTVEIYSETKDGAIYTDTAHVGNLEAGETRDFRATFTHEAVEWGDSWVVIDGDNLERTEYK